MLQQSSDMDPDPQLYKTGYFRKWHYTPSCTSAVWSCRAAMWKAIHPMNDILALLSIESFTYFTCIFLVWLNRRGESWNYYHIYLFWHCSGSCGFSGHVFNVYASYLSLINAVPLSVVIHTKNNGKISRYTLLVSSECSRPKKVKIRFLWLASLNWIGKTDALEKYTAKPKAVNLCSRYSSSAHLLWKPYPHFQCALQIKRKLCSSAGRWLLSFLPDESVWFRCRAAPEVSAGSLWPPSMWLIHLANLCHRFIVFRWSVHWQMTCDQFNYSAPWLSQEIEWYHCILRKNEQTCFR